LTPNPEPEYAQILFDGGAAINQFGATAAHNICKVFKYEPNLKDTMENMLQWFINDGGDVHLADSDRVTLQDRVNDYSKSHSKPLDEERGEGFLS
jgi:hypothetical protein